MIELARENKDTGSMGAPLKKALVAVALFRL